MTLLGKIFTVMIFLMSVLFMGFSVVVYATHVNWRLVVDNANVTAKHPLGLKQQVESQIAINKLRLKELEKVKSQLAAEQAARRFALAALETRLGHVQGQLSLREAEYATLLATSEKAAVELQISQNTLQKLTVEIDGLRTALVTAQSTRDEEYQKVLALTDKVQGFVGELRTLNERRQQLLDQIASMQRVMQAHDLTPTTDIAAKPPTLDGIVTAVSEKDLIVVSLGRDDGLREGHQLHVYRGGSYLARVIVKKTEPHQSVAQIIPEYRKGVIQRGDFVATKIKA